LLVAESLTEQLIGHAITVHRLTGPGLLESVYEQCLCHELREAGLTFQRQAPIPITYRGMNLGDGFKADLIVEQTVIVEIKAVTAITPTHEAQLRTYLRMGGLPVGLLLNFNDVRLIDGLRRFVNERDLNR
jgi:GxxExxY protein